VGHRKLGRREREVASRTENAIELAPAAFDALRRHRIRQAEVRLRAGGAWDELGLVFANEIGRPLHPANLTRRSFRPLLERAGVPQIRFHDLRHTCATILLARGSAVKQVSEMLGHASVAITLDIYGHVTPTMHRAAAATWSDVLAVAR
jgi:integrase